MDVAGDSPPKTPWWVWALLAATGAVALTLAVAHLLGGGPRGH